MTKIRFNGPRRLRLRSFLTLNRIAISTYARHIFGQKLDPTWSANLEIGVRFWRHQFTQAMRHPDIAVGRQILDSLVTETDDDYHVTRRDVASPKGHWIEPHRVESTATILYLHGGGYAFHGQVSHRFADMLAHRLGARVFAPDYRLTPEYPHPAQAQDALAAWQYLMEQTPAKRIVLIGDSAGGHMVLTLLQSLRDHGEEQPALCIGLCPWTDIGNRGDSLYGNDPYDLVQGWMALLFGKWLDPENIYGRAALSPISYDYKGLAPMYLQTGGREILRDMAKDFAEVQARNGADVMLDLWPDMPHDFQGYDTFTASSSHALARIRAAVAAHVEDGPPLEPLAGITVTRAGLFSAAN